MRFFIFCLLLLLSANLIFAATDHEELHGILSSVLKENEKAAPILNQMQSLIQTEGKTLSYESVTDIGDSISVLYNLLLQAQVDDDKQIINDTQEVQKKISKIEEMIKVAKSVRQKHIETIFNLKEENKKIDDMYEADKSAYYRRVNQQDQIKLALEELVEKSSQGLLDNPNILLEESEKNDADTNNKNHQNKGSKNNVLLEVEKFTDYTSTIDNSLPINTSQKEDLTDNINQDKAENSETTRIHQTEVSLIQKNEIKVENGSQEQEKGVNPETIYYQVKNIGHGKPIEALVQLSKIFSKTDAEDLVFKFQQLLGAVEKTQRIDQQKEDYNLNLYNTLTNNIENNLLPSNEIAIELLNAQIKEHKKNIEDLKVYLRNIINIYNLRKNERANAISYSFQASESLQEDLEFLKQSEIIVRSK